ncbi:MAG: hypothetical protein MUF14_06320, partial [Hyphomonadaceae bacterium]|nr:hypothetical protein [Hyphomonadaceae bacterium]
ARKFAAIARKSAIAGRTGATIVHRLQAMLVITTSEQLEATCEALRGDAVTVAVPSAWRS